MTFDAGVEGAGGMTPKVALNVLMVMMILETTLVTTSIASGT